MSGTGPMFCPDTCEFWSRCSCGTSRGSYAPPAACKRSTIFELLADRPVSEAVGLEAIVEIA